MEKIVHLASFQPDFAFCLPLAVTCVCGLSNSVHSITPHYAEDLFVYMKMQAFRLHLLANLSFDALCPPVAMQ